MDRRNFLLLTAGGLGSVLFPYSNAEAFIFGGLIRLFVGGVIRRSITRGIASGIRAGVSRSAGRAAMSSAARRSSMRSIASLGLAGGLVASVSPSVYAMAEKYDAEGIWVRDGYDNEFTSHMKNDSNAPLSGQFYYAIEDVESGRTDREHYGGLIYAAPKDAFKFSFEVRDLPYTGVKRIVGRTDHPNIRCEPSGNVVVASADQVYTK